MLNPAFYVDVYWDEGMKRYSNRTLGDDIWGEGRLLSIGEIVRSLSDPQGSWVRGRMTVDVSDADSFFRTAIQDTYKPMYQREAVAYILSDVGRTNPAAVPLTVFRGFVDENAYAVRMGGSIGIMDWLGHRLSPFNPDREVMLRKLTRGMFSKLPEDLIGVTQPIVAGDHTDHGRVNSLSESAEKGRVVAMYVGNTFKMTSDGSSVPPTHTPLYLDPPVVTAEVVGTPGTRKCVYSATSLTKAGETTLGNRVALTNVPNNLNDTNYVRVTVTPGGTGNTTYFSQVTGHIPYVYDGTETAAEPNLFHRLDDLFRITAWDTTHTRTYLDDGDDSHSKPKRAPKVNTAKLEGFADGASGPTVSEWDTFFLCGHAINPDEVHQGFWPDWEGEDGEVKPAPIPEAAYGESVLFPGKPGWPHATPYVDVTDTETGHIHRCTLMYARGERSKKAVEGAGRFAFNTCGLEENGDGTGEPIRRAFYLVLHIMNQFVALNAGVGYYTGLWGNLEVFPNSPSVTMLDTLSFHDAQDYTVEVMGTDMGALADFIIDDNMTVGQFMQHVHIDFDCNSGPDMWGRLKIDTWNLNVDATSGNAYRRDIEFVAPGLPEILYNEIENKLRFQMDYNNEDGEYASDIEELNDTVSQGLNGYRAVIGGENVLQLRLVRDLITGRTMMGQRHARRAWAGRYYTFKTNLVITRDDIGNQIQVADPQGFWGDRDTLAAFKIMSMTLDPRLGEYTVRCRYMNALLASAEPLLQDETGDVEFLLRDELLPDPPPVGAYRLQ